MATSTFIEPEVVLGTTTSWLPVTTAYPSVSGCAEAFFWFPGQPGPAGWDPGYGYFAGGSLRCLPPQATSWWELPHQNPDGHTSLSIQPIVCPAAFTTAATEIRSVSSTLVMCCPSGYDLKGGQPDRVVGACLSPLSSGQILTYTAQASNYSWISSTLAIRSASSVSAVPMLGWNVARTATSTPTLSATSTKSPTSTSTNGAELDNGLSTGAKAGIGVAAAVVVIGLLLLVGLFVRRQRRRKHHPEVPFYGGHMTQPSVAKTQPVYEMPYDRGVVHEMPHKKALAYEMPHPVAFADETYQQPVELESRQTRKPVPRRQ